MKLTGITGIAACMSAVTAAGDGAGIVGDRRDGDHAKNFQALDLIEAALMNASNACAGKWPRVLINLFKVNLRDDIGSQRSDLEFSLFKTCLYKIANAHESDEGAILKNRQMAATLGRHRQHCIQDRTLRRAGGNEPGHQNRRRPILDVLTKFADQTHDVTLRENADHDPVIVNHRRRTDPPVGKESSYLWNRLIATEHNCAPAFLLENLADGRHDCFSASFAGTARNTSVCLLRHI
jgi:hypothetical protein